MLNVLDKYKFGILAALVVYIGLFMYFQMGTYTEYFEIEAFHDGAYVEEPKDIELEQENIEVPPDYPVGEVKNMVNDRNDTRERSYENYTESAADVEQSVRDLEKQFFSDAGGNTDREKIKEQANDRKKNEPTPTNTNPSKNTDGNNGGDNAYKGKTMVDFYLKDRDPFQKNRWHVRNPGYTCGVGSGTVRVNIRVNQNGNVTSATISSSTGNECMNQKALEYAKKSRFDYSGKASESQSGWIEYIFISQ